MPTETAHLQVIFERTTLHKPSLNWVLTNVSIVNESLTKICNIGGTVTDEMIFDLTCSAYWINQWYYITCGKNYQRYGKSFKVALKEFSKTLFGDSQYWKCTNTIIPQMFSDCERKIVAEYEKKFDSKYGVALHKDIDK